MTWVAYSRSNFEFVCPLVFVAISLKMTLATTNKQSFRRVNVHAHFKLFSISITPSFSLAEYFRGVFVITAQRVTDGI